MTRSARSIGAAGGAISLALFDVLVSKNILTAEDAMHILKTAQMELIACASPTSNVDDARHGALIIDNICSNFTK